MIQPKRLTIVGIHWRKKTEIIINQQIPEMDHPHSHYSRNTFPSSVGFIQFVNWLWMEHVSEVNRFPQIGKQVATR